jgi:NifU-like protein involved in Fe-S cluster formation
MSADKILDYDKLVEAYNTNLDVTLRGFRPAEEMLDTWVPDEDPIRSLVNLVEAAQLCGSKSVSVRVANKTLEPHSAESVKEKLGSLGEAGFVQDQETVVFTISKLQETSAFRSVRPIYQQKLRARFGNLRFKRALKVSDSQIPLRATEEQVVLAWAVQTDKHVIADAVIDGAGSGPMEAALDQLCEILIGLPIQEAREHAIIRLEFALRAPGQRHAVSGIVLPHNADPLFRLPSALVNRLFDDYKTSTGYQQKANDFDPGPGEAWKKLSPEEREKRASAAIASGKSVLDLEEGDVQVIDCKQSYAITVRFGDRLSLPTKRRLGLALERLVREKCDPRLELFCEEKKDLSKLRRMFETEKAKEKAN